MAEAISSSRPRTVEDIFKDFTARRSALIRALTNGTNYSPLPILSLSLSLYIYIYIWQ